MLKTERLLETVFLLLGKRKVTAEELAARFGVCMGMWGNKEIISYSCPYYTYTVYSNS